MIKVQYVADIAKTRSMFPWKCNACGISVKDNKTSIRIRFEYDSVWNDIVLCGECRRELYEKI